MYRCIFHIVLDPGIALYQLLNHYHNQLSMQIENNNILLIIINFNL